MKPGLEVDRSVLINKIMQSDSGITFKKEDDVNGSSNYIGIDNTIAIQLIGSEHELTLAKFTFAFTQDKALNRKEILKLYNFAYILTAKPGYEWLISVFNNFEITKGFDETQIFNFDRKGEFKYVPGDKKFVLTFVPF